MSETKLSVRLRGDLPPEEELTQALGVRPTICGRRGMPIDSRRPDDTYPVDLWGVDLIDYDEWQTSSAPDWIMARAAQVLWRMAPGLKTLDRARVRAQLYISSIRNEDMGGFDMPTEVIEAAGAGRLELSVSILVMLTSDEDTEDDTPE